MQYGLTTGAHVGIHHHKVSLQWASNREYSTSSRYYRTIRRKCVADPQLHEIDVSCINFVTELQSFMLAMHTEPTKRIQHWYSTSIWGHDKHDTCSCPIHYTRPRLDVLNHVFSLKSCHPFLLNNKMWGVRSKGWHHASSPLYPCTRVENKIHQCKFTWLYPRGPHPDTCANLNRDSVTSRHAILNFWM